MDKLYILSFLYELNKNESEKTKFDLVTEKNRNSMKYKMINAILFNKFH